MGSLRRVPSALQGALKRFAAGTDGAVAVIAAAALPILIGVSALSLEYGHGLFIRVENQRIADLASYAGASAYAKADGTAAEKAIAAGKDIAALNGIDPAQVDVTFPVDPTGGVLVRAEILTARDLMLARVLPDTPALLTIRTWAESRIGGTMLSGACILGLDTTELGVFINGSVVLDMPDCAIASSGAMSLKGTVDINSACISPTEPSKTDACEFGWYEGGPFEDPYSGMVEWPGNDEFCDHGPGALRNTDGALAASAGGTLAQGVHCIDSDVDISGNQTLGANGPVSLVFAPDAHLKITGKPAINIKAPASGDMKGVLIHAPQSDIHVAGTVQFDAVGCEGIVARTIKFSGTVNINAACSAEDREKLREKLTSVRLVR